MRKVRDVLRLHFECGCTYREIAAACSVSPATVSVMPTGSGKTRLACAAMAAQNVFCLCLVPTQILLHQWHDEIARHYQGSIGCVGEANSRSNASPS